MANNLHRLAGGIAKRERDAIAAGCAIANCGKPTSGLIDTLSGPKGICVSHAPGAVARGYTVHALTGDGQDTP